jgi:hypothetical protein
MSLRFAARPMLVAAAAVVLAVGCNNTASPTSVAKAQITVSVVPTPVTAIASQRVGFTFAAPFKVVINEVAGQGGEVEEVTSTLYDLGGLGEVGELSYDSSDLVVFVGSKRVEANGSLTVPMQIDYVIASDATAKDAFLNVVVRFKDDKANNLRATTLVRVQ